MFGHFFKLIQANFTLYVTTTAVNMEFKNVQNSNLCLLTNKVTQNLKDGQLNSFSEL